MIDRSTIRPTTVNGNESCVDSNNLIKELELSDMKVLVIPFMKVTFPIFAEEEI